MLRLGRLVIPLWPDRAWAPVSLDSPLLCEFESRRGMRIRSSTSYSHAPELSPSAERSCKTQQGRMNSNATDVEKSGG